MSEVLSTAAVSRPGRGNPRRRGVPKATVAAVLIACARRCCLCFGIEGDIQSKTLQIAHVDRDAANNDIENLAALCPAHHDDYDSRRSQTKGITPAEVKTYRDRLQGAIAKRDETVVTGLSGAHAEHFQTTASANTLGKVVEATDAALVAMDQHHERANGLRLAAIGKQAASRDGDFEAAVEAAAGLVRIASSYSAMFGSAGTGLLDKVPRATPYTSARSLLVEVGQVDYTLLDRTLAPIFR